MSKNDPVEVFRLIDMTGGPDVCHRWLGAWGGRDRDRRPYFMANGRRTMAYRWVWELVHGQTITPDQMILHSCDNGGWPIGCCNIHHMRLGDNQENMDDMTARQRHGLPASVVSAIRRLIDRGDTKASIGEKFGVSRETVSAIANGRAYKRAGRPKAANISDQPDISVPGQQDADS